MDRKFLIELAVVLVAIAMGALTADAVDRLPLTRRREATIRTQVHHELPESAPDSGRTWTGRVSAAIFLVGVAPIAVLGLRVVAAGLPDAEGVQTPLSMSLGLGGPQLVAMWPAVNGYFFLPTYGTII